MPAHAEFTKLSDNGQPAENISNDRHPTSRCQPSQQTAHKPTTQSSK